MKKRSIVDDLGLCKQFGAILAAVLFLCTPVMANDDDDNITEDVPQDAAVGVVKNDRYPFSTVGQVRVVLQLSKATQKEDRNSCTGTLVGKDLVLTAAHCFSPDGGKIDPAKVIEVQFIGMPVRRGRKLIQNYPDKGIPVAGSLLSYHWNKSAGQDWALIKLQEPIGNSRGWLGVMSMAEADLNRMNEDDNQMLGFYDNMSVLYSHHDCEYSGISGNHIGGYVGFLKFDCKFGNSQGDSGGPMLHYARSKKSWYVIGVLGASMVRSDVSYMSKVSGPIQKILSQK